MRTEFRYAFIKYFELLKGKWKHDDFIFSYAVIHYGKGKKNKELNKSIVYIYKKINGILVNLC